LNRVPLAACPPVNPTRFLVDALADKPPVAHLVGLFGRSLVGDKDVEPRFLTVAARYEGDSDAA